MTTIFIEELKFKTIIGLLDFERITPQYIVVDAKFRAKEFVDYALVCEYLVTEFNNMKFETVEEALKYFRKKFKKIFPTLRYFYMKISKIDIIPNARVGAQIEKYY